MPTAVNRPPVLLTLLLAGHEILEKVRRHGVWVLRQVRLAVVLEHHEQLLLRPHLGLGGLGVHLHLLKRLRVNVHSAVSLL